MRKTVLTIICAGIFVLAGTAVVAGELENTFEEAICQYFSAEQSQVDAVRAYGIGDEDIPVVFYLAKQAKTSPEKIAKLSLNADSWANLAKARNLSLKVFYIHFDGDIDSYVYSPIIEQYRSVHRRQWNTIPLSDADVVNMVNLKLVASGFDYNIFKVMELRDNGKGFVQICHEVSEAKEVMIAEQRAKRRAAVNAGL